MMRSLFSGVSGLKTHQTKMDVIGNNIANVNTTAYKASSITFSALMSQTTQRASGANAATGTGGVNARQIGLGVKSGAINVNIAGQGSSQSTGNPFDVMITGENFFVVSDGSQNYFTRDGSFYVDGAGNLAMTSLGYNVMGWQVDEATGTIKKDTVSALRIMSAANMTYPPEATSEGYMSGVIDKNDTDVTSESGRVVNFGFYDQLGYAYTAKFVFRQSDDRNVYSLELDKIIDEEGVEVPLADGVLGGNRFQPSAGKMTFDNNAYTWTTGNELQLNGQTVARLSEIIDVQTGAFRDGDYVDTGAGSTGLSVDEQLKNIAAAYGYKDVEQFLGVAVSKEVVPATGNDPAVTADFSIKQMLLALGGVTGAPIQQTVNGTAYDADALPTFTNLAAGEKPEIETSGRYFDGYTVYFDAKNGKFNGVNAENPNNNTITLNLNSAGLGEGNFSDITINLSEIGMWDNKGTSTIGATNGSNDDDRLGQGAGRRLGDMIGVSIQQNGMIYASYDNGMTKLLGQIATARFANASGLEKQADNLYSATLNSGEFDGIGVDITANGDYMSTGQLEMSNVDLSSEFTEMITTQRGFQANSRIITVSDTLLEELTNLKR
ncbi:MAG: flagellar hook-basal body complex protein [Lachnospiraceae bacterium]|nr:flagellar hook-basal body complex protein [Lachnospiraceae bacterium]